MRIGMGEYKQACKNGYCWMCADKGYVAGNGAAQSNPTPRQAVPGTTALWEAAVRRMEDPV